MGTCMYMGQVPFIYNRSSVKSSTLNDIDSKCIIKC